MQISNNANVWLSGYIDDLVNELKHTKRKLETEQATAKRLDAAIFLLKDENEELLGKLFGAKIKYKKNKKAGQKLEALRLKWTGIADVLGPEMKDESEDEYGVGDSDMD
jgi:predicted RNase H-like nuclease (RuvC/YqgF family)